ncbi:lysophospholipid acyltransferase family protein [Ectobacillus ponti]|uniref:1-acyl-sn-glycerol-3-phosphate acyltransferase n=1 Tax=Ectobacillus ponti TaxID=2961894 RepID=A0AA42BPC4_9BACI|nr:lysophospholipid acyltransferase family protein [Ectobacillus ponti]MCP8968965.1 1-acyl-sn-glycerol-3-phosphate acyltransferase [Ectobacillus ponti]
MLRTIYTAVCLIFLVLGTVPSLLRMQRLKGKVSPQEFDRLVHRTPHWFGRGMLGLTGSQVEVRGLENMPKDQAVLIVGNHQSNFDIPLLMGYLEKPIGFVAKAELKKIPIASTWIGLMNGIFMNRSDRRQSLQAIKDGIEALKQGHSLVIFPEGTRSKSKEMGEFKTGSLSLAVKSGVPIVPVTVNGTYNILEANGNRVRPAKVVLTVSKPVYAEEYQTMDSKALTQHVQEIIASKL